MTTTAITIEPTLASVDRRDDGFGRLETPGGLLPLVALAVEARVTGLDAATELRQSFVNHTGAAIEATYIFPLPDRAAVHRFRMTVGERVVEGVIDERGRARDTYDQAIAAGQRAAIAEEDRPGVFTLRVGNLMPGDRADITLALVGPLPVEDGEVTFAFPLVVAPRYVPGAPLGGEQAGTGIAEDTDRVPDASRISPPVLLPGFASPVRLSLTVTIDGAKLPIAGLRASLHEVDVAAAGAGWRVELRPGERLDRDFILRWAVGDSSLRSGAVWAPDDDGEGATVAITLVPPVGAAAQGRPRDVVLLLDRSGSMSGWKMVAARRAAARIVDSLGERDRFAVLAFDDRIDTPPSLGAQLVRGDDRNRFRAVEFLAGVDVRGGTEMAEPLELASWLLAGSDERDRVLVLVTDGQVGNEDELLRRLTPQLAAVRVFTLGIDQAVNAAFLRRLAAVGGGACELVESELRLDEVMAKIHLRIATPVLIDVMLSGDDVDRTSVAPQRFPALFAGAPLVVRARWRGQPRPGAALELRGRLPAGDEFVLRVALDSARPGAALAQSWARAHIRDLEDRYAAAGASDRAALERTIVAVSLRHRVLSRFTAFVAVDREVVRPGGELRAIAQPVERPAGWVPRPEAGFRAEPKILGFVALRREREDTGSTARARRATTPAPSQVRGPGSPPPRKAKAGRGGAAVNLGSYGARMRRLADELARAGGASAPEVAAQVPVAQLGELLEDLYTVELDAWADVLAPLVERLRAALADGEDLAAALRDVADALRKLAAGPPTRPGRAFWR